MDLAKHTKDQTTAALLRSGNYKQAIKNIDKKLKKTPKDNQLIILKACALLESGEPAEASKLCQTFASKYNNTDPITDLEQIVLLYYALVKLSEGGDPDSLKLGETIWQNAIKHSTDRRYKIAAADRWASEAVKKGQWGQLVKAANHLSKLPSEDSITPIRAYYFWQIVGYYLTSINSKDNALLAQTNGKIALKMLADALDKVPGSKETNKHPEQWIANTAEFNLLSYMYEQNGRTSEVIEILDGEKAKVALHDEIEIARLKFQAMLKLPVKEWDPAIPQHVLQVAIKNNYDWMIEDTAPWFTLVRQGLSGVDQGIFESLQTLFGQVAGQILKSRALRYSKYTLDNAKSVHHTANEAQPYTNHASTSAVDVSSCAEYFKSSAHRSYALTDTLGDLAKMNASQYANFRNLVKQGNPEEKFGSEMSKEDQLNWLVYESNLLYVDLDFLLRVPSERKSSPEYRKTLEELICNSLRLYRISRLQTAMIPNKDTGPGDEACRIAASGLIEFCKCTGEHEHNVQAAAILAFLLEDSPYNFRARLTYVQLLRHMSMYSLAGKAYDFLDVKEILYEELGPLLFTRISSTFPNPTKSFDAYNRLAKALEFYNSSIAKLPKYEDLALEHGNYEQVIHFVEFAARLEQSNTRALAHYERRRIARVLGRPLDRLDTGPRFTFPAQEYQESGSENARKSSEVDSGPSISALYIDYLAVIDGIESAIQPQNNLTEVDMKTLTDRWKSIHARVVLDPSKLSAAELRLLNGLDVILDICYELSKMDGVDPQKINLKIQQLEIELHEQALPPEGKAFSASGFIAKSFANWNFFHALFLEIEYRQICSRLADRVLEMIKQTFGKKTTDITKEIQTNAKKIQQHSKALLENYKKEVSECRNHLADILGSSSFVEAILGSEEHVTGIKHEIYQLMGYQNAKRLLGDMGRSALEAYDGVIAIKLI